MSNKSRSAEFRKETKEAKKFLDKKGVVQQSREPSPQHVANMPGIYKGLAWVGAAGIAVTAGYGILSFLSSDRGESLAGTTCDVPVAGGVSNILNGDSCLVKVESPSRVNSKVDQTVLLDDVIEYSLKTDRKAREGIGVNEGLVGLVVSVEVQPGNNYGNSILPELLGSDGLSTATFLDAMKHYGEQYDVPKSAISQGCIGEMDTLMSGVRTNPDKFSSEEIPSKEIVNPNIVFHSTNFAPYTEVPVPKDRIEVIFEYDGKPIICPEP